MLAVIVLGIFFVILNPVEPRWFQSLNNLKPKTSAKVQAKTVEGLLLRLLPEKNARQFIVKVDPTLNVENETVIIDKGQSENSIQIVGTSGVAVAFGIQSYLKEYCNVHISWDGDQLSLPETLPQPKRRTVITSVGRFRYYSNVCTYSYSFVWWNWTQWERHLDWMALNGINLPLAHVAQESIWLRAFMKLGLSRESVDNFLTGPAFLAWNRMGNLKKWGGPLSDSWHAARIALQMKILKRMLNFGMTPVMAAFAGHVPDEMTKIYPNATIQPLGGWAGFNCSYSCLNFVEPTDPLFLKIGSAIMNETKYLFGLHHAYSADPFNEMTPKSFLPSYINAVGKSIYRGMSTVDPEAVWVMQAWMFVGQGEWRHQDVAQALATSTPSGNLLFLDLWSEEAPIYHLVQSYFGQPFVWCMLHDFGGRQGLYGSVEKVNQGLYKAVTFPNSTLVGTGLTMEGINQNYPIYAMALDLFWSDGAQPLNQTEGIMQMSDRRYGRRDDTLRLAWNLLWTTVYTYNGDNTVECYENYDPDNYDTFSTQSQSEFNVVCRMGHSKTEFPNDLQKKNLQMKFESSLLQFRPNLNFERTLWYDPRKVCQAWKYFVHEADQFRNSSLFRRDLVDVTRQILNMIAGVYYQIMVNAFRLKDAERVRVFGDKILQTLTDMDTILSSDDHFLLGHWLQDAQHWATSEYEKLQYMFNAKNQITLWGPNGEILDYARKQWGGLVEDYHKSRWSLFAASLIASLTSGDEFDQRKFDGQVFKLVEKPFSDQTTMYPRSPIGDSVEIAKKLFNDYSNDCKVIKVENGK